MQTSEEELIARSKDQDADAYGQLVDRYKQALYRHCFALMRDEDAAEDVAQETFITAYYKLHSFDSSKRFSTWIFKIATNKSLNALRQNRHTQPADDNLLTNIISRHTPPDILAEHAELQSIILKLKPKYRAVIHLYYFEGLSYDEIAAVMMRPVGSIKGWMNRAKAQLRKELS